MAWGQLLKTLLFLSKNYVNTPRDVYVSAITTRLWLRGLRLLLGAVLKASLVLLSGSNLCHHKMCLFGRRIYSGWLFCKKLRLRKWALLPPHNRLKKFRHRACSQNRTITRDLCEHRPGEGVGWGVGTSLETRVTLRPRLSAGPAHICAPDTCFSVSMGTAFLPSEFTDHYPRYPLLSLAEHGTEVHEVHEAWEGFSSSGKFPVFLVSPTCCRLVGKSCLTLLRPPGPKTARLLCPWDSPGKNTGVGCQFLLQGTFRRVLYHWATRAAPLPCGHVIKLLFACLLFICLMSV